MTVTATTSLAVLGSRRIIHGIPHSRVCAVWFQGLGIQKDWHLVSVDGERVPERPRQSCKPERRNYAAGLESRCSPPELNRLPYWFERILAELWYRPCVMNIQPKPFPYQMAAKMDKNAERQNTPGGPGFGLASWPNPPHPCGLFDA